MKLINKKKFTITVLNQHIEIFMVNVTILLTTSTLILQDHPLYEIHVGLLVTDKAFVKVLSEYLNYADVFLLDLAIKLL